MKKQDIVILAVLFALWIAWPTIDRQIKKHFFHSAPAPVAEQTTTPVEPAVEAAAAAEAETKVAEPVIAEAQAVTSAAPAVVEEEAVPEKTAVLENEQLKVTLSSRGAAVVSAELKNYRTSLDIASPPVVLDFSDARALAYSDLSGVSAGNDFAMEVSPDGKSVQSGVVSIDELKQLKTKLH